MQDYSDEPRNRSRKALWFFLVLGLSSFLLVASTARTSTSALMKVESINEATFTDDGKPLRTALVMPCTIAEAVWTLPLAMKHVLESRPMPAETIIVFGLKKPLEEELLDLFPPNLNENVNTAKMNLLHFFQRWSRPLPNQPTTQKLRTNPFTARNFKPNDFYDSLNVLTYLAYRTNSESILSLPRTALESLHMDLTFLRNLYEMNRKIDSIEEMAEKIPNFKIYLNVSKNSWANQNRQIGTENAFKFDDASDEYDEIISFCDCDDFVNPPRVHMIEQVFRENEETMEVLHQYTSRELHRPEGHQYPNSKADAENYMVIQNVDPQKDTTEWRELMYDYYFNFRTPSVKAKLYALQESPAFLYVSPSAAKITVDPRNLSEGNVPNSEHFTWFVGFREEASVQIGPQPYYFQNGHSSFRRKWLLETIGEFPNSPKGEDSRLSYLTAKEGGKILGIPAPLTTYVTPVGDVKRGLLKSLIGWNQVHGLRFTNTLTDEQRDQMIGIIDRSLKKIEVIITHTDFD